MKLRRTILVTSLLITTLAVATRAAADESAPALLAAGRADDAITTLHSKISASPSDGEAYNLLCRAYFSMGDWDRGISACEKAVALAPNNSRYHMWLGRIYGEKADGVIFFKAASLAGKVRNEFETAVRLDPEQRGRAQRSGRVLSRSSRNRRRRTRQGRSPGPELWQHSILQRRTISTAGWRRKRKIWKPPKKNIAPLLKPAMAAL